MRDVSSAKPGYTDTETRQGSEGFAVTTVSARNVPAHPIQKHVKRVIQHD